MTREQKLQQYFNLSRESYMIGNCELMVDQPYATKIARVNEIYYKLRKLEKEL